jgi:hypothetical protein
MDLIVHIFERVFGHNGDVLKYLRQNPIYEALREDGFS